MNMEEKMLGEQVVEEVKAMVGENIFSSLSVEEVQGEVVIAFVGLGKGNQGFAFPLNHFKGSPREIAHQMLYERAAKEKMINNMGLDDFSNLLNPENIYSNLCAKVCTYEDMGAIPYKDSYISLYVCISEDNEKCAMAHIPEFKTLALICAKMQMSFEDVMNLAVNNTIKHRLKVKDFKNSLGLNAWLMKPYLYEENIFLYKETLIRFCKENNISKALLMKGIDEWIMIEAPNSLGKEKVYLMQAMFKSLEINGLLLFDVVEEKFEVLS